MTEKSENTSRRDLLKWTGAAGIAGLAGCAGNGNGGNGTTTTKQTTTGGGGEQENVRGAWLYISQTGDRGWSWAHDQGRKWCDQHYDWLDTAYSEAVPPADAKAVLQQYANQDYDIIFGTTFAYMQPMYTVAQNHPNTLFEHATGYKTRQNMGRYMGRIYQDRYLTGIAAGMLTDSDLLGYVAAFPLPEVVRGINAFALGAQSVNKDAEVLVRWINAWYDPTKTRQAAQALIDQGVDVMAQHMDSPAAVKTANENNIWSIGYDSPMAKFGGEKYITSPFWNWEAFYAPTLISVKQDTWKSDFFWGDIGYTFNGMNNERSIHLFELDDWGPQVPQNVKDKVANARSALRNDEMSVWGGSKFEGKSERFLFREMSSFVPSVRGKVPE
ncbi:MAG: BMP family ABC transporter substrate-binding protein [Halodesulfurarchaeum sp.]